MSGKREAILASPRAGKSDSAIAKTLLIARSTVWKTLKRYKDRSDCPRCGRPPSQRSKLMMKCIRERIRRNPRRRLLTIRKTTANMRPRNIRRLVHKDRKMFSFTLQKEINLSLSKACGKIHRNVDDLKRSRLRACKKFYSNSCVSPHREFAGDCKR